VQAAERRKKTRDKLCNFICLSTVLQFVSRVHKFSPSLAKAELMLFARSFFLWWAVRKLMRFKGLVGKNQKVKLFNLETCI
jgi:hypothetical protein